MITLLLASLLTCGQEGLTFSYLEPAAPLSRLMPALSKVLNVPLDVSPALASDVVCVDVHDVTAKDLLDRLARATVGQWERRKDGTLVLLVSNRDRQIQATAELKRRAALITKTLNPPKPADEPDIENAQASLIGEGEEFGKNLLKYVDPAVLAQIADGERVVFSTNPNAMQLPFAVDPAPAVLAMVAKHNKLVADSKDDSTDTRRVRSGERIQSGETEPIKGRIAKALVVVVAHPHADKDDFEASLHLYDAAGRNLNPMMGQGFSWGGDDDEEEGAGKPVEFSHETRLFGRFVASQTEGVMRVSMEWSEPPDDHSKPLADAAYAEAMERFLSPDKVDPLAYVSDLLRTLAGGDGSQVVACLPDSFASSIRFAFGRSLSLDGLRKLLLQSRAVEMTAENGWIVARPRNPTLAEAKRTNRSQLRAVINMLHNRDVITLADQLEVARLGYGVTPTSLVDLWCSVARPSFFEGEWTADWEVLRFYAALDQSQLAQLDQFHTLTLQGLSDAQLGALNRLVYEAPSDFGRFLSNPEPPAPREDFFGFASPEVTEAAPNGLPNDMVLTLAVKEVKTVRAFQSGGKKLQHVLALEPMPVRELVDQAAMREVEKLREQAAAQEGNSSFQPYNDLPPRNLQVGTRKEITLRLRVNSHLELTSTIHDDSMTKDQMSFEDLNAQNKDVFDKWIKGYLEMQRNLERDQQKGNGGATPPL